MARPAVYVVRSTINPGVPYTASRAEYEHLIELNILSSLDEIVVPADQVLVQPTVPPSPLVGQVWFNTSIP